MPLQNSSDPAHHLARLVVELCSEHCEGKEREALIKAVDELIEETLEQHRRLFENYKRVFTERYEEYLELLGLKKESSPNTTSNK